MEAEYAVVRIGSVWADKNVRLTEPDVDELAASIKEKGLLQPIVVAPKPPGKRWQLIAGFRRLAACRKLAWKEIPAVIRNESLTDRVGLQLTENLQRTQLSHLEIANSLRQILEDENITVTELARRLGKSFPWVRMHLDYGRVSRILEAGGIEREEIVQAPLELVTQLKDFSHKKMVELFREHSGSDDGKGRQVTKLRELARRQRTLLGRPNAGPRRTKEEMTKMDPAEGDEFSIIKRPCELKCLFVTEAKCHEITELLEANGGEVL